jgi:hypothetical protein
MPDTKQIRRPLPKMVAQRCYIGITQGSKIAQDNGNGKATTKPLTEI